jgi:hypothetical protein
MTITAVSPTMTTTAPDHVRRSLLRLTDDATHSLRCWQRYVKRFGGLLEQESAAVAGLAEWYNSAANDPKFAQPAPQDGIDALVDALASASLPYDSLVGLSEARWAIRVAEELVATRARLRCEPFDPSTGTKLELLLREARQNLET